MVRAIVNANILTASVENFTTGATLTYSPLASLSNRLTVGFDKSQRIRHNIRPFGYVYWRPGSKMNDQYTNRVLTLDYVGTYSLDLTSSIRSNFSWGRPGGRREVTNFACVRGELPGRGRTHCERRRRDCGS